MNRTAIYCRVSSTGQEDGYSLETQESRCRAHAQELSLEVVGTFRDVHTGAEWRERQGLSRLRQAVRSGEIDVVIAFALDRLSRKQAHVAILAEELAQAGVRLEFVTERFEDSSVGEFIRSAKAFAAEVEREKLAERTVRGRIARVQSGKLIPGGRPPFGYRWRDATKGELDEDPETAPVVRRIFKSVAGGTSLTKLASGLMEDKIGTPTGRGVWHASTLAHILHSPRYRGEAYGWGIRKAGVRPQTFDPAKAIRLPDGTIPPLVDEQTWEAVQVILRRNKAQSIRSAKNPEAALLRGGFARCGSCGRTLKVRPRSDGGTDYYCGASRGLPCARPTSIKASVLDPAVWERAKAIITNPAIVACELERLRANDPTTEDLGAIARSLAELERQRGNLVRAIALVDHPDAVAPLTSQLNDISARHQVLLAEQSSLEQRRAAWQSTQTDLDSLTSWCNTVAGRVDTLDWSHRRSALIALNFAVSVYPNGNNPRYVITADVSSPVSTTT